MTPETIKTDVLIIGSGIAGLTAAKKLSEKGVTVTVVTKADNPAESNTKYAQGGINAIGAEDDSPEKLIEDTLIAAGGRGGKRAAEILAQNANPYVRGFLEKEIGIKFDEHDHREGGHQVNRTRCTNDSTGRTIEEALVEKVSKDSNINILTGMMALDLLTTWHHTSPDSQTRYEPNRCVGAYLLDKKTGRVIRALAKETVLATGGASQVYKRTSNPEGATGDGVAMASRAGVAIQNLEYVQFHPTTFVGLNAPSFLVTEAARGSGGKLRLSAESPPFMENYDPRKDIATRDIVSRAIKAEMEKNGAPFVYLDMRSYLPEDKIKEQFPMIRETLLKFGVDIAKDLIPVAPAAHFMCGGVWNDAETGATSMENLWAAGEVATNGGIHGANRLASNSLLAGGIWGEIVAKNIALRLPHRQEIPTDLVRPWEYRGKESVDGDQIRNDLEIIRSIMWTYVGLVRTSAGLARAKDDLSRIERTIDRYYQDGPISAELITLRNLSRVAALIADAAWENKSSAGCHYRQ